MHELLEDLLALPFPAWRRRAASGRSKKKVKWGEKVGVPDPSSPARTSLRLHHEARPDLRAKRRHMPTSLAHINIILRQDFKQSTKM